MLVLYVVIAYGMYRRILPLSAVAACAEQTLRVLSDAVTNILAVKTYGREDYERGLFTTADRAGMAAENVNMRATMRRGFTTSGAHHCHHVCGLDLCGGWQRLVWY